VCALQYFKGSRPVSGKAGVEARQYEFDLRRARDPVSLSIEPLTKYVLLKVSDSYKLQYLDSMDNWKEVHQFGDSASYWQARDLTLQHIKQNLPTFLCLSKSPKK